MCREVAGSALPSVRDKHEEHVKTAVANLQRLDEALKGISEKVSLAAHEKTAWHQLYAIFSKDGCCVMREGFPPGQCSTL